MTGLTSVRSRLSAKLCSLGLNFCVADCWVVFLISVRVDKSVSVHKMLGGVPPIPSAKITKHLKKRRNEK